MRYILSLFILVCSLLKTSESLRILVCFPAPSKSHSILGHGVADRLLEAGHEVVHITSYPKKKDIPKLTEIAAASLADMFGEQAEKSDMLSIKNMKNTGNFGDSVLFHLFTFIMHKKFIEDPKIIQLLSDPEERFDAVVLEWFFSELNAGIPQLFGAPLIWIVSTEPHWQALRLIDETVNPAYGVDMFVPYGAPLSFYERLVQLVRFVKKFVILNFFQIPLETWAYNRIYADIAAKRGVSMPSYSDAIHNGSFMFFNAHSSIGGAMRLPQNAKTVAGYHIQDKVKPLPKDLQTIMDGAKNGVIYFSLGSNLKSDSMSEEMIKSLLEMFSKLDQIVIWKFESEMDNSAPNVHLVKWAPQQSVLAHPNLKLFITHGGLLSITEAVHYGVPLVGIPIMGDQYFNMGIVERKGLGVKVSLAEDMADELLSAVRKVLLDESFKNKAKELSTIYHYRQMKPGAELAYWVEYIVKTRGAPHLRSPALTVSLYQRFYLDLLVILIAVSLLLRKIFKYVLKLWPKKSTQKKKKQ